MSAAVAAMNSELAPARLLAVNERDDRLRKRVNTSFTAADMPMAVNIEMQCEISHDLAPVYPLVMACSGIFRATTDR